jgi:hypothetical protein
MENWTQTLALSWLIIHRHMTEAFGLLFQKTSWDSLCASTLFDIPLNVRSPEEQIL